MTEQLIMLLRDLELAGIDNGANFHESSEVDSTELFQFLDLIDNFIQFLIYSSLNPRVQLCFLGISLRLSLQLCDFILQLLTYIMLKCINLPVNTDCLFLPYLFQFRVQFLNESALLPLSPFLLRLALIQESFELGIMQVRVLPWFVDG